MANAYNKYLKKWRSQKIHNRFIRLTKKKIDKRQNPSKSDQRKAKTLHNKSLDDLKKLLHCEESWITRIYQKKTLSIHCWDQKKTHKKTTT